MICIGDMVNPGAQPRDRHIVMACMGWRATGSPVQETTSASVFRPHLDAGLHTGRLRFRGQDAQGAGQRFSNRHWTTAFATSKHVPISFKGNPAAVGVTYPELESVTRGVTRGVLTGA